MGTYLATYVRVPIDLLMVDGRLLWKKREITDLHWESSDMSNATLKLL